MKIVHVYKDYHPPVRGGIEQTIETLAHAQVAAGHEVSVLVSASGQRRSRTEMIEGVRVVRVAEWARALSSPLCPGFPASLARIEADVWNLHFPNPLGEVSWLSVRPRGALVVTYHADIVRQRMLMPLYGPVIRRLLKRADVVLSTSEAYRRASPFLQPVLNKCLVAPSGIPLAQFDHPERYAARAGELRTTFGVPHVLFVGRLRYYKGVDVLLRALALTNVPAFIVGDGPMLPELIQLHRKLGLGERVRFVGAVSNEELQAHLHAASIGVLPSVHPSEALGLALIEFLAVGIPAICTELGTGTTFVNLDGITGLVVPPRDAAALAGAINRLAEDPALRARLGGAGGQRAREIFSDAAMVRAYAAAYEIACSRHSGVPSAPTREPQPPTGV